MGLWFIQFGATTKDLGYLGLWDCSPFRLAPLSAKGHSKTKFQYPTNSDHRTCPFLCFGAQQTQILDETLMIQDP